MLGAEKRSYFEALATSNFREYLRIRSVHPDINYESCVKFLKKQAESLELPEPHVYYCSPDKPIVIITWPGQIPSLPSILLSSHMDVVPVYEDKWSHPPFDAEMDEDENIFGRGSQDMKCVGIQYLEAIRKLKNAGVTLMRTVHVVFVPDKKTGSVKGMKAFVETDHFRNLNVGFALGEGIVSSTEKYVLVYGERCSWKVEFHCPGSSGHGSLFLTNTAIEKVNRLVNIILDFRQKERRKLSNDSSLKIGDVTTINVTMIKGGVHDNVIPAEIIVVVDCRLPASQDLNKWEETLQQWCKEAGEGVWLDIISQEPQCTSTMLDDSNEFWNAFKKTADKMSLKLKPEILGSSTDSRFLRKMGIPCVGFSPINNTPVLLHDHDEHLNLNTFLCGIEIYFNILNAIANVP